MYKYLRRSVMDLDGSVARSRFAHSTERQRIQNQNQWNASFMIISKTSMNETVAPGRSAMTGNLAFESSIWA